MQEDPIREALNAHWRASAAGEAKAEHDGRPTYTVSIMQFLNGKVVHETQYFAGPFEAPAWRSQWVQRIA